MKIILGAGGRKQDGWIATDRNELDLTDEISFERFFKGGKAEAFLAEHVWEHIPTAFAISAAAICRRYLAPGGRLRIAVPDALNPDEKYIEWVRPGGIGAGANDHKALYDHIMLRSVLTIAGFSRVIPLEWWDDTGGFHFKPWKVEDGFISRSLLYDHRNRGQVNYTSLILDAIA